MAPSAQGSQVAVSIVGQLAALDVVGVAAIEQDCLMAVDALFVVSEPDAFPCLSPYLGSLSRSRHLFLSP